MTDPLGLGVPAVINAGGAQSRLGGAVLSPEVRAAMDLAGTVYVEVERLHDVIGAELATLTRNEGAAVAAGSAAGIMVAVAAVIAGADSRAAALLPRRSEPAPAIAVWRAHLRGPLGGADAIHDNEYINSIHQGGGRVRIMDAPDAVEPTDAAVLWFPGMFGIAHEDELLAQLTARAGTVPVIVDAADQIPPFSRTWAYTRELGASLAIFSGGKGLGGPTSSGLVVGRADLIAAFRANSGTEHSAGRVAKVGREELLGLLSAVRIAAALDEDARYAQWQGVVDAWLAALSGTGIPLERVELGHCGQRVPRLLLGIGDRLRRDAIIDSLWERDPRIAVLPDEDGRLALSPQLLQPGEAELVLAAVRELLG